MEQAIITCRMFVCKLEQYSLVLGSLVRHWMMVANLCIWKCLLLNNLEERKKVGNHTGLLRQSARLLISCKPCLCALTYGNCSIWNPWICNLFEGDCHRKKSRTLRPKFWRDLNYVKKLHALACIVFARSGTCVGERQVAPQLCPTLQISRTASVEKKKLAALPEASFSAVQHRWCQQ